MLAARNLRRQIRDEEAEESDPIQDLFDRRTQAIRQGGNADTVPAAGQGQTPETPQQATGVPDLGRFTIATPEGDINLFAETQEAEKLLTTLGAARENVN